MEKSLEAIGSNVSLGFNYMTKVGCSLRKDIYNFQEMVIIGGCKLM
jgi:hypothetical protein